MTAICELEEALSRVVDEISDVLSTERFHFYNVPSAWHSRKLLSPPLLLSYPLLSPFSSPLPFSLPFPLPLSFSHGQGTRFQQLLWLSACLAVCAEKSCRAVSVKPSEH